MNNLDNLEQIKKMDPQRILGSIEALEQQVNQVWQEFGRIRIPQNYKMVDKILLNGMGGSALGGHVARSVFFDQLNLPFGIINGYSLPASLDKKTLYIISSYSGNTEEPISTFAEARKRGAKVFGIAAGGKLGALIRAGKLPGYVFKPVCNPSGQPRMGLGYSLGIQMALLKKLGLLKISGQGIKKVLARIEQYNKKFGPNNPAAKNPAKKIAAGLKGKIPVIVASEFLSGNAHVFANQVNENAKNFAVYFLIPELNHHLLDALKFPAQNNQNQTPVFFVSGLYHSRNLARYKITKAVAAKSKIKFFSYKLTGPDKISQVFEAVVFSSYVSFYLAILNNVNPALIPQVDYLKLQLKKRGQR